MPQELTVFGISFWRSKNLLSPSDLIQPLKKHVQMVHEGQRPYKCEHCDKAFTRKRYLTGHVLVVHEGKKPWECDICHQGFRQRAHLQVNYFCFATKVI